MAEAQNNTPLTTKKKFYKKPLTKNRRLRNIVLITLVIFGITVGPYMIKVTVRELTRGPKPESKVESQFPYGSATYDCSKPISGEWERPMDGLNIEKYYFVPTSESELDEFCRIVAAY